MEKSKLQFKNIKFYHFGLSFSILIFTFYILMLPLEANAATISRPMQSLGLVGYWSFDVGKGTAKAVDMSGRGNNGTLTNMNTTAAWVGGKIGNALEFNGAIDASNGNSVNIGTTTFPGQFTVSFWWKNAANANTRMAMGTDNGGDGTTQKIGTLNGNFFIRVVTSSDNTIALPSQDVWHFIVITRDASNKVDLYVDNGPASRLFTDVAQAGDFTPSRIGAAGTLYQFFKGSLDEVRVYNRALSADEIKRLYRQTSPQFNASQANKLRQGLVGMWTFDGNDMGTTSAIDRSGNGNTGWLISGPKKVVGKIGQALSFDGVDDRVDAVNESNFDFERTSNFSISGWIFNQKSSGYGAFVSKASSGFPGYEMGVNNNGAQSFSINICNVYVTDCIEVYVASALPLKQWAHFTATYDGSSNANGVLVYVNGEKKVTTITQNNLVSSILNNGVLTFGSRTGGNSQFTGLIDEVRVYNRALTEAEIKQLYKAGSSFHPNVTNKSSLRDGLVGHWSFDGADMGTTSARDASGSGNTGWLINGPKKAIGRIGQALNFDGVNDYVDLSNDSVYGLSSATSEKTISAWIKTSAGNASIMGMRGSTESPVFNVELGFDGLDNNANGIVSFLVRDDGGQGLQHIHGTTAINDNTWHHVVVTRNSSKLMTIYVDGRIEASGTDTMGSSVTITDARIGDESLNTAITNMNGLIDEVRVYNRALSPAEIKRLYNMGR